MDRRVVVIGPPPTPNGELEVGHACCLRAAGRRVLHVSATGDGQTHVVASAARRGTAPHELAARSTRDIQLVRLPGFDNSYPRGMTHLASSSASGARSPSPRPRSSSISARPPQAPARSMGACRTARRGSSCSPSQCHGCR